MEREIIYDRETRDYAIYVDGNLIGFKSTYHQAELEADRYIYNLLTRQPHITKEDAK